MALAAALKNPDFGAAFIANTPKELREPLLQHYGYATRWIDLVDNAWIALWFGLNECVEYRGKSASGPSVHWIYRKRRPAASLPPVGEAGPESDYAYILLFQPGEDAAPDESLPGLAVGKNWTVADLRRGTPSLYVRPHAQHGLLARRTAYCDVASTDLSDGVVGRVRVHLVLADEWLGAGNLLSVHHLFPPPHFDGGYWRLLGRAVWDKRIGTVAHVNS